MARPVDTNKKERLTEIIESLSRPLEFASKDDFAHIESLKGLGTLVERLSDEALGMGPARGLDSAFRELKETFTGFDDLGPGEKKERVLKGIEIVKSMKAVEPVLKEGVGVELKPLSTVEVRNKLNLLKTPLEMLKGIGPGLSGRLKKKGLTTVEDVLYYLPFRYEDRRHIKKIGELKPGTYEVVTGEVMAMGETRYGRRKLFEVVVSDGSGLLKLKEEDDSMHMKGIVPIYSQIENLHQKTVRRLVRRIVEEYAGSVVGGVPADIVNEAGLMGLAEAFREAHAPNDEGGVGGAGLARKSITFDELFTLELGLALKRSNTKKEGGIRSNTKKEGGIAFKAAASKSAATKSNDTLEKRLLGLLPFTLTTAQKRAIEEIRGDMASPHPMNRLIQGDVGSGKTMVSFIAALIAIESGCHRVGLPGGHHGANRDTR
jgi:ATP-dependent DNA helicase RecG